MHIKTKYAMGSILKEIVTGFEGVAMGITLYQTGCVHYGLVAQSLNKDGGQNKWEWFDESRLEDTGKVIEKLKVIKPTSGEYPDPE
jgi:hypothetical protein